MTFALFISYAVLLGLLVGWFTYLVSQDRREFTELVAQERHDTREAQLSFLETLNQRDQIALAERQQVHEHYQRFIDTAAEQEDAVTTADKEWADDPRSEVDLDPDLDWDKE